MTQETLISIFTASVVLLVAMSVVAITFVVQYHKVWKRYENAVNKLSRISLLFNHSLEKPQVAKVLAALQCHRDAECAKCPYNEILAENSRNKAPYSAVMSCLGVMTGDAVALIKAQSAQIDSLQVHHKSPTD